MPMVFCGKHGKKAGIHLCKHLKDEIEKDGKIISNHNNLSDDIGYKCNWCFNCIKEFNLKDGIEIPDAASELVVVICSECAKNNLNE